MNSHTELPHNLNRTTLGGSPLKFHPRELIENGIEGQNIEYNTIVGKCVVFKVRENESVTEPLRVRGQKSMAYVCRYKLVKESVSGYRLEPVSWLPGDDERQCAEEFSDFDDQNVYTDTDTQSEPIVDLNETIEQIRLSLQNGHIARRQVSPIRIVNNSHGRTVCKSTKDHNQMTVHNKRASPDASTVNQDVSPNKRNKLTHDHSSYDTLDSPQNRTGRQYASPAIHKMKQVKKNLNRSSFLLDTNCSIDMDETPTSPYDVREFDKNEPLKMTLRKKSHDAKTPLKEHNDNAVNTPQKAKVLDTPINVAQRSIMKSLRSKW